MRTSSCTASVLLVRVSCTPTVRAVLANMEINICFRVCEDTSPLSMWLRPVLLEETVTVNPEHGSI